MREWLETDGLGGYASGVESGPRSRRYHSLLTVARRPPVDRVVLVNGFDAWVEAGWETAPITSQRYLPNTVHPDGQRRLHEFTVDPWPTWTFHTEFGITIRQELLMIPGRPATILRWTATGRVPSNARLVVRPLFSGRDHHGNHRENPNFNFTPEAFGAGRRWRPYPGIPPITVQATGGYEHNPVWYRNFVYEEERARGLDPIEDLASPGFFHVPLNQGPAHMVFFGDEKAGAMDVEKAVAAERERRAGLPEGLARAASSYVVKRGKGRSVIAGYPWFSDWGRDTFISLRGLCLALGELDEAESILSAWASTIDSGLLPNRFPDDAAPADYGSADAALWFVVAVHDFFRACKAARREVDAILRRRLEGLCEAVAAAYRKGTTHGIRMSFDHLLACGTPGSSVTWMDARHDGHAFTPRVGKPVELQALWLAAVFYVSSFSSAWSSIYEKALESFRRRFWNAEGGYLFDVVDVNHETNVNDASFRPNQLLAIGGLPWTFLELDRARAVVDLVEKRLVTRLGLRTLAPDQPGYRGRYEGGPGERDAAYHQGTVWPWLMGPFVEAWIRVRGDVPTYDQPSPRGTGAEPVMKQNEPRVRREARARFFEPFLDHLKDAGLGHVSEILDGDFPHQPRGCPFQAWSVAELIRLDRVVLA